MCIYFLLIVVENNASWMCRYEVKGYVYDYRGNIVYFVEVCFGEDEVLRSKWLVEGLYNWFKMCGSNI